MKQKLLNKLWLRVGMIVAIMTTALAGTAWAESETITFADLGLTDATQYSDPFGTNISVTFGGGGNDGKYYNTGAGIRTYGGGTITIGAKGNTITAISTTFSGNSYAPSATTVWTSNGTGTGTSGTSASWSGSATEVVMTRPSGSGHWRLQSITVTYTTSGGGGGGDTPTTYTVTYNANGGTGTMTDTNSPYEEDDVVTLLTNTFTAPEGMMWSAWDVKDADDNAISVTNNTFSMPASNVTVTAQWVVDPNAPQYEWVETSLANLTSSDIFVIVGNNGTNYALSSANGTSSAPPAYAVTIENGKIDTDATPVTDALKFNISGNATDGYTFYPNGSTTTYIYCLDSNNGVRIGKPNANATEKHAFTVLNGYLKAGFSTARYIGIYNSTDWRCYTSTTGNSNIAGQTFKYYKRQIVSTDPVIVASDPAELAYDAANGEFNYSITNPTGASLSATSNADWITNVAVDGTNSKVTFSTSTNTAYDQRTGTITLSYTGADNKVITITQAAAPVIYTTIPALFAKATEVGNTETNVNVTFGNWVVSGVHNNNVFLTDNQGNGLIIYTSNHGFAVNDKLSGTVSETPLKLYNGFAEFTNLTASTSGLTVTKDGEITVITNKTIAELGGVNTGAVITLSNLTYDGTNLSDGTNTIKPYNSLYNEMSLTSGNTYNITGVYQQYSNTKEILPRSAADIEEYLAPKHTVTFFVNGVEQTDDEAEVSEGAAITFPATPADVNGKTFMGWTTEEISGTTDTAPTIVTSATMGNADVTYYAVFATSTSGGASDTYSLVSDVNDLSDGDNIILVSTGSYTASGQTHYFTVANGNVNSSSLMDPVDVTITDDQVTSTDVAPITLKEVTGGWKLQMGTEYINIVSTKNQITLDENGAVNTISITSGDATIGTADGSDTRNIYYNPNSGNGRFAYYKSAQKPVSIYKQEGGVTYSGYCTTVAPATESVTVTDAGYATYCSENALDFTNTDIKAYVGTKKGDKLTFTPINQVPANTGMLLVYASGKTENVPVIASATAVEGNCLVGVNAETTISSNDYILNKINDGVGFYKAGSWTTLGAHKAYIPAAAVSNGVKGFAIDFDDDATGISLMEDGRSQMEGGVIYNLAGQRISKMQKGINIVNGKKILK